MKKQVYKIDENGFIKEIYVAEFDKSGNPLNDLENNIITISPIDGLYRAKWTGEKWTEGATQEEIDELTKVEPSPPTEIEELTNYVLEVDFRLIMIEMGF